MFGLTWRWGARVVRHGPVRMGAAVLIPAAILLTQAANVQAASNSTRVVNLVGNANTGTIMLSPVAVQVPNPKPHTETVLSGKLPLVVQNMTDRAHAIKLLYVPLAAGSIKTVASARLPAHSIERLTLPFQIPASVDPSSLNGTIIAETFTPADPQQFTISVTGQLEPFGDVRFDPSPAIIRVTRWCIVFTCNTTNGGVIRLRGSGVVDLLAYLTAAGTKTVEGRLYRDGRVVTAQLGDFRLDGSQPGAATADLVLEDKPGAGEYKGTIPVSTLVAGAPALPVEVHSRYSIVWAVLAIFLGVLAAGALYQQIGLWQRKRLLERALTEAVDEDYMAHRGYNLVPEPPGRLIQDLNIQCPLRYNDEWQSWARWIPLRISTRRCGGHATMLTSTKHRQPR